MKLDGFDIQEQLGTGGMATVYRARQISLDREVAIKVFAPRFEPTPEDREQFQNEARVAARLKHPGLVQVYDAIFTHEMYCFVMELINGYTVGAWSERKGHLAENQVLDIADCVAAALDYAWVQHGIIHCDIKPDNLMVDSDGTVKILDLGLCKTAQALIHQRPEEESQIYGTPQYLSPEQAIGQSDLDCRTDIYSLGATMYHLATGQLLFPGHDDTEVMDLQVRSRAPNPGTVNPSLSPAFCSLVEKMLCKDRDRRQKDWHEVRTDIGAVRMGLPLPSGNPVPGASTVESAPPPAPPQQPRAQGNRRVRVQTAPSKKKQFFRPKTPSTAPVVTGDLSGIPRTATTAPSGSGHGLRYAAIGILVAIVAAGMAANISNRRRVARETARQKAVEEINALVAGVEQEPANSPAFDAAVDSLEQMRSRFTALGPEIDAAQKQVLETRQAAERAQLKKRFDSLVSEALSIARTGNYEKALAMLFGGDGDEASEFAAERERAKESIQEVRRAKEAEERRQEEERRSQEEAAAAARAAEQAASIANQLMDAFESNGLGYATSLLDDFEIRFASAFSTSGDCATLRDLFRGAKAARERFEGAFRPDSAMTLTLRNGTPFRGKLLRFDRNTDELVFLTSVNGIDINRTLSLKELAPKEILTRLGDGDDIGTRFVRVQLVRRYDLPVSSNYYLDDQCRGFPARIRAAALGR